MTRYFSALLIFMVVFSIGGAMFDAFASPQRVLVTILLALVGAGIAYCFGSDGSRKTG